MTNKLQKNPAVQEQRCPKCNIFITSIEQPCTHSPSEEFPVYKRSCIIQLLSIFKLVGVEQFSPNPSFREGALGNKKNINFERSNSTYSFDLQDDYWMHPGHYFDSNFSLDTQVNVRIEDRNILLTQISFGKCN